MINPIKRYDPTIAELERVADRLTGCGILGLTAVDWPVLVAALEDYIAIRRGVEDWNKVVQRAAGVSVPNR